MAGIDEAGRGPWAGPVVAAAVLLDASSGAAPALQGVRDSKALGPGRREELFAAVRSCALSVGIGWALPEEIDRRNILQATRLAMLRAFRRMARAYGPGAEEALVVVDGTYPVPGLRHRQLCLVSGDSRSLSVACASVAAKVLRDRWMRRLDARFPGYGFSAHKGYGTAEHVESLARLGPSEIHRLSFAPVKNAARTGAG